MLGAELAQLFRSICPPPAPGAVVQRLLAVMTMVLIFALASALPSVAGFGGISFALRADAQGLVSLGHGCVSSSPSQNSTVARCFTGKNASALIAVVSLRSQVRESPELMGSTFRAGGRRSNRYARSTDQNTTLLCTLPRTLQGGMLGFLDNKFGLENVPEGGIPSPLCIFEPGWPPSFQLYLDADYWSDTIFTPRGSQFRVNGMATSEWYNASGTRVGQLQSVPQATGSAAERFWDHSGQEGGQEEDLFPKSKVRGKMAIAEQHETASGDVYVQQDRVFAPWWAAEISPRHTFQVWNATEDIFGAPDYSFDCFAAPEEHILPQDTDTLWWCVFSTVCAVSLFRPKRPRVAADSPCRECADPDKESKRKKRDGMCQHQWFCIGYCNDLMCPDGEIWRCVRCGNWYCDGPCDRFGAGRPPLLNHIQVATVAAVEQGLILLNRNDVPWAVLWILVSLAFGEAVTCRTCFDQIVGCTGGAACPFLTTAAANGVLMVGGAAAAGAATALVARDIFPLRFTRVLHRGILDSLLLVGRRPPPGTPVDVSALTTAQLSDPVATAGVELDTLLQEVASRLAAAATQIEISRLNAITTNLSARQKLHSGAKGAVDLGDGTSTLVGVYRYSVVLAMRIVRTKHTDVAVVTEGEKAGTEAEGSAGKSVPPAKLSRPTSMAEFSAVLTVWTMLLAGLGIAPLLVTGAFLMDVVYDHINEGTVSWQTAFELLLVYLEEVERTPGDDINLSNVYNRGAQDTFLRRARERTPKAGLSDKDKDKDIFRGDVVEWNGSWNRKATQTCITYNLGNKKHPANCLNERGGCKFLHACDHWVDNKGPGGTCGGDHPRVKCTNPNKCDDKVK